MSKSIAVFGAGPGLGHAVARRYAREGYAVTLVGRRPEPLERLANDLTSAGATAHVITADLSDTGATPRLAEQIRAHVGAAIKNSAFHVEMEKAKAAGDPVWEMPIVDPEHLAGMLWAMHETKGQREAIYP